jgi:hypothetical protein
MPEPETRRSDAERQEARDDYDMFYDGPQPVAPTEGGPAEVLLDALSKAGPEAAEHLVRAAKELLLAARAVVEAGERVVRQQRGERDDAEPQAPDADTPRVRRIDVT